jgi:ABC-type sugar transport system permease subunit
MKSMGQFKFGSAAAIAIMSGLVFIIFAWAYLRIQDKEV